MLLGYFLFQINMQKQLSDCYLQFLHSKTEYSGAKLRCTNNQYLFKKQVITALKIKIEIKI